MKTIKYINTFAIALPLTILMTYPVTKENAFIYSLLSTTITGFLQVLIAIKLLYDGFCDRGLYIYFTGVVLFFILWHHYPNTNFNKTFSYFTFSLPPLLAAYLSILVYKAK